MTDKKELTVVRVPRLGLFTMRIVAADRIKFDLFDPEIKVNGVEYRAVTVHISDKAWHDRQGSRWSYRRRSRGEMVWNPNETWGASTVHDVVMTRLAGPYSTRHPSTAAARKVISRVLTYLDSAQDEPGFRDLHLDAKQRQYANQIASIKTNIGTYENYLTNARAELAGIIAAATADLIDLHDSLEATDASAEG